jgi:Fur family transcriptional regulator, ferric uptake regulator
MQKKSVPSHKNATSLLQNKGLRSTPVRKTVLQLLLDSTGSIATQTVEAKLGSSVHRVTLYRVLRDLEQHGVIHRFTDPSGTSHYGLCSKECSHGVHHDCHPHFLCVQCRKVICLEQTSLPAITTPAGYQLQQVTCFAEGLCPDCASLTKAT